MKKFIRAGRTVLSALLLLVIAAVIVSVILPAKAEPRDTYHSSWQLIRETADEDGASFAAVYDLTSVGITSSSFGNFASKDSSTVANGGPYRILSYETGFNPEGWESNEWMFTFCGKNYNDTNDTFSFNLIGWSKTNGMLQNIAEGDCVLGTQAVVIYPDGGDALGELVSETSVAYTHANKIFTVTNEAFDGVVVGMLARVSGTGFTSKIAQVTTVTDTNNIRCSGLTSSGNGTDATVQINPAFWIDTINLDETTKWTSAIDGNTLGTGNKGTLGVINSGDNEVAAIVVDLKDLEWIQFVIYVADAATDEEAGAITVYGRKYK